MATGRNQKGMNRRNHHDSLSQSGQQSRGGQKPPRRQPGFIETLLFPKASAPKGSKPKMGGNTSGGKKPYKAF